jgi:hypothetical protein
MAITMICDHDASLSLEEYIDYVRAHVEPCDLDSALASAPQLRALANNRAFLVRRFNAQLSAHRGLTNLKGYAPHSFNLFTDSADFYVRANVWTRPSQEGPRRGLEERLFSYASAHDHNFSFMTVGYAGPGYETEIYEYDYGKVAGSVDERVEITFLEATQLTPGKIMLYRASRDIHIQHPPPSLSISLNLMLVDPETLFRDQFFFDLERGCISGYVTTPTSKRVSLMEIAKLIGDASTVDIVDTIARAHPCRRTRLAATDTCAALHPAEAQRFWKRAASDREELVRLEARKRLEPAPSSHG